MPISLPQSQVPLIYLADCELGIGAYSALLVVSAPSPPLSQSSGPFLAWCECNHPRCWPWLIEWWSGPFRSPHRNDRLQVFGFDAGGNPCAKSWSFLWKWSRPLNWGRKHLTVSDNRRWIFQVTFTHNKQLFAPHPKYQLTFSTSKVIMMSPI